MLQLAWFHALLLSSPPCFAPFVAWLTALPCVLSPPTVFFFMFVTFCCGLPFVCSRGGAPAHWQEVFRARRLFFSSSFQEPLPTVSPLSTLLRCFPGSPGRCQRPSFPEVRLKGRRRINLKTLTIKPAAPAAVAAAAAAEVAAAAGYRAAVIHANARPCIPGAGSNCAYS